MKDELTVEQIAQVCHEANREYCSIIGDDVAEPWHLHDRREITMAGVRFYLANPIANPIDAHGSWLKDMTAHGWTYGPVKDSVAKTHPQMLPYHELPFEQRRKDALFIGIVRALTEQRR